MVLLLRHSPGYEIWAESQRDKNTELLGLKIQNQIVFTHVQPHSSDLGFLCTCVVLRQVSLSFFHVHPAIGINQGATFVYVHVFFSNTNTRFCGIKNMSSSSCLICLYGHVRLQRICSCRLLLIDVVPSQPILADPHMRGQGEFGKSLLLLLDDNNVVSVLSV